MKKIMFAGAEVMPFGATGGLGDVLGSLPAAIKAKCGDEADVSVVMPLYAAIKPQWREKITLVKEFTVALSWRNQYCGVKMLEKDGVKFYFIDNEYYFGREKLYGYYDDGERFAFFSKPVVDMMAELDIYPDIFNANDWQTAAAVVYLKRMYADRYGYDHIKTVFTIHNIEYQGKYSPLTRGDLFGLRDEDEAYLSYDGCLNLMKGAIVCADKVSTVSGKYAEEILGEENPTDFAIFSARMSTSLRESSTVSIMIIIIPQRTSASRRITPGDRGRERPRTRPLSSARSDFPRGTFPCLR